MVLQVLYLQVKHETMRKEHQFVIRQHNPV